MFSAAEAYERFMGRWSRRLAPQLVAFAAVRDGDEVLDVGAGTGALTSAVVAAAPSSHVVGVDRSEPYVAFAQAGVGNDRVRFQVGDAESLLLSTGVFDRTLSLLILNFVPDADHAVAEMIRVTRPGGIVAAAIWDYGEGMELLRAFWDEAVSLDPGAEAADERHMPLCRRGELAALWHGQGLENVAHEPLTIETAFSSFDDYWAPFLEKQGPAGAYVASLSDAARGALELALRRRLLGNEPDRPFALQARAWAVRGVVPVPASIEPSEGTA